MTNDEALKQALAAMREAWRTLHDPNLSDAERCILGMTRLDPSIRAAETALAESEQEHEPAAFDHSIGEGRFQVVRGAFWWHIKIGNCTALYGKFHSKLAAEDMALKLLTAYRDGAFEQYKSRPVRAEPLTDEELRECFTSTNTSEPLSEGWPGLERFARAVERAHGIGS